MFMHDIVSRHHTAGPTRCDVFNFMYEGGVVSSL